MMKYGCPGLVEGFWLRYPMASSYPEIKCKNWIGWWQKTFFGMCDSCLKEKHKRGIEPNKW